MEAKFEVEPLLEHEYLVRAQIEGEVIESRIRVGRTGAAGVAGTDERRVVSETAVFLAGRQPVIDFPPMLDLADVIASYDDFPEQLKRQLTGGR